MLGVQLALSLAWLPNRAKVLLLGVFAVTAVFIIAKLIILVKNIVFNWL